MDASTTLAWCFPEEKGSGYAEGVLDLLSTEAEAAVPSLWPLEVANALLVAEKRKRRTMAQVTALLQRIVSLPVVVDSAGVDGAFGPILAVAREGDLTEYDAPYLELALREALPLSTLDEALKRAARSVGVALLRI